jgi:pimeloyl-ACP methyl ester carboxylesterase
MRRFLIGFAVAGMVLIVGSWLIRTLNPPPVPTPTATPRPSPVPPTIVPTEVREGIYLESVAVLQPDLPSGTLVPLPVFGGAGETVYTYDGNLISINVAVASSAAVSEVVRVTITDEVLAETIASGEATLTDATRAEVSLQRDTINMGWAGEAASEARTWLVQLTRADGTVLDSVTRSVLVVPRPVVLAHGWNSSAGMWDSYDNYLADAAPGWLGLPADNLSTGLNRPFRDAVWNSDRLDEYIEAQRNALDAQHVDIVSHSMGGLIGRAYLQRHDEAVLADGRPTVLRLLTLGTPSDGSPCAGIAVVLNVFSRALDGAWHFTPEYMARFNQQITDTNGTFISPLGGADVWTCGVSGDGVVPVGSATAYGAEVATPARTTHIPNVEVWRFLFGAIDYVTSEAQFEAFVLPRLQQPWDTGAPLMMTAQAAPDLAMLDAPPVTQRTTLTLPPGSRATHTIVSRGGGDLGALFEPVEGLRVALFDSRGRLIAQVDSDEMLGLPVAVLPFEDAPTGTHSVQLTNTGTRAITVHFAVFETGLAQVLDVQAEVQIDGTVLLIAQVSDGANTAAQAQITAQVLPVGLTGDDLDADAQAAPVEAVGLARNEGGYRAVLRLTPGTHVVAVQAQLGGQTLTETLTIDVPTPSDD